jgi:hypothetical protein
MDRTTQRPSNGSSGFDLLILGFRATCFDGDPCGSTPEEEKKKGRHEARAALFCEQTGP